MRVNPSEDTRLLDGTGRAQGFLKLSDGMRTVELPKSITRPGSKPPRSQDPLRPMEALRPIATLQPVESTPAHRSTPACGSTPTRSNAPACGSTPALHRSLSPYKKHSDAQSISASRTPR
ncbi:hypothetical protein Nepgr_010068 [Nepenthes gracilis]|uniref:Uncharacterized protein n=1 Tax=Nepenthes gracilis TaxID=150966 RepID=A0AAD3SBQ3_NEPGR|nr:hypothetical protein Nepgr_010068 [Nepenthes gracilis]